MSLSSIVNRILNRQADRERAKVSSYMELVQSIHAGTEPSDEELEAVLLAAQRTVENLAADVECLRTRSEDANIVAREPEVNAESLRSTERFKLADQEYNETVHAAKAKIAAARAAFDDEQLTAQQELIRIGNARARLQNTSSLAPRIQEACSNGIATVRTRDSLAELRSVGEKRDQLESQIRTNQEKISDLEAEALIPENFQITQPKLGVGEFEGSF